MKRLLLLLLTGCLLSACTDDQAALNPSPIETATKANLGPNALSWVNAYVGKQTVTFRNDAGQTQTFGINSTKISEVYLPFDTTLSETFELLLTSTQNPNQILAFKPAGRNFLAVGNTPQININDNKIFGIFFSPISPAQNYWAQVFYLNKDLLSTEYTYGPLYPSGGSDALRVVLGPTQAGAFFRELSLRQGAGVEYYVDANGTRWRQVEIR